MKFFLVTGDREGYNFIVQADNREDFQQALNAGFHDMLQDEFRELNITPKVWESIHDDMEPITREVRRFDNVFLGVYRIEASPVFRIHKQVSRVIQMLQ